MLVGLISMILSVSGEASLPESARPRATGAPAVTVPVGDPAVNGLVLRPYQNRFLQSTERPDGTIGQGISWTDVLEETNLQGRPLWRRTIVVYRDSDGAILSTGSALFDRRTLAPVSSSEKLAESDYWHLDFTTDSRAAAGVRTVQRVPRFIQWSAAQPAFDLYNGTFGLVLAALPLRDGETGTMPAVLDSKEGVGEVAFSVTGREVLSFGGVDVQAGVVRVDDAGGSSVYWLRQEGPFLLKIRRTQPGPSGTTIFTWTAVP